MLEIKQFDPESLVESMFRAGHIWNRMARLIDAGLKAKMLILKGLNYQNKPRHVLTIKGLMLTRA